MRTLQNISHTRGYQVSLPTAACLASTRVHTDVSPTAGNGENKAKPRPASKWKQTFSQGEPNVKTAKLARKHGTALATCSILNRGVQRRMCFSVSQRFRATDFGTAPIHAASRSAFAINSLTRHASHHFFKVRQSRIRIITPWVLAFLLLTAIGTSHPQLLADDSRTTCAMDNPLRIGAVHFPLLHPRQIDSEGMHGLEQGIPSEIVHRLSHHLNVMPRQTELSLLFGSSQARPDPQHPDVQTRARNLSALWGLDYLLAGVVLDVGWEAGWPRIRNRRHAEIEIYLFDGKNGIPVLQHRASGMATGDILHNRRIEFGSQAFFRSDYGKVFDHVLTEIVDAMRSLFSCPEEND